MEDHEVLARLLAKRFIARSDVKAVQRANGAYNPNHSKFIGSDLIRHLQGKASFGHYLLNADNRCKLHAYDIDLRKEGEIAGAPVKPREIWTGEDGAEKHILRTELITLATGLACRMRRILDYPVAVAYSGGKGVHVYGLHGVLNAAESRDALISLLEHIGVYEQAGSHWHNPAFPNVEVEIFPKQASAQDGEQLGNLMRLPLGVNARTKQAAFFLQPNSWEPADPVEAIQNGTVTRSWLKENAR